MRITLEDSTTKIHAYVIAKNGETTFYGYPGTEKLRKKHNKLLGIRSFISEKLMAHITMSTYLSTFFLKILNVLPLLMSLEM